MKKKKIPNSFSTKDLLISMLLGWLIVFVGAWAGTGFRASFLAMPRFVVVIIVSIAGAIVIGPAIYGFLYLGRNHEKEK
ncbi:hypothetical protein ICI50_09375 [Lactobacillus kefiranofaciens]|uniref:hypothetical protein n=1 Tax=Lactobacillus kefiranofaciens TaxID=267818 RepID=UPI00166CA930|nr:hypothetical protein [Lactobacillus kefiranofaciens]QNT45118.1 hypothetical protein ICI50_09375 [Lactobacillus kefiranofaciens]